MTIDQSIPIKREVIYQTRERVFHPIFKTQRSGLEKRGAATNFEVFGTEMKHPFKRFIYLLKLLMILGEIQRKNSPFFMVIEIAFSNLLRASDGPCFLFLNY